MTTRLTLALVIILSTAAPSLAREIAHTVAPAETLGDIAQVYYRNAQRAEVIQLYNNLESSQIKVGTELRIPVVDEHVISSGESWSGLAARYWGDGGLHRELAIQTTGSADTKLRIGQKLLIPVLIPYRIKQGETLVAVSRRFYGHPGKAQALARVNGVETPRRLQVGAPLKIPLADLGPPPAIPPASAEEPDVPQVSSAPPQLTRHQEPSFGGPLRRAINAYLDGRYDMALERLETVRPRVLAEGKPSEQALLLRHLVFVYVAFDRNREACESYRALRQIDPDFEWHPDEVSPKILGVVEACNSG
jgi:LysM repeat protein